MTNDTVFTLDDTRSGVPLARSPLWWDRRLPTAANIGTIQMYMVEYSSLLPPGCHFDEAAIMVPPTLDLEEFALELSFGGWQQFNRATDLVYTNPFGTRYLVEYLFFRHDTRAWRLEVMRMKRTADGRGFSPLHQALWTPHGRTPLSDAAELPIPHLSFKAPASPDGPASRDGARALRWVLDQGTVLAQACQSTYGHFWYCLPCDARKQLYLKPRVNLRDGGEGRS